MNMEIKKYRQSMGSWLIRIVKIGTEDATVPLTTRFSCSFGAAVLKCFSLRLSILLRTSSRRSTHGTHSSIHQIPPHPTSVRIESINSVCTFHLSVITIERQCLTIPSGIRAHAHMGKGLVNGTLPNSPLFLDIISRTIEYPKEKLIKSLLQSGLHP